VQVIMKGLHIKTGSIDWFIPKVCDAVAVPPLVGMIIAGCLARNYLCKSYMDHYPEELSSWCRLICLSIILLRGGLELDFTGKGLTMVLLTLLPQCFEAAGVAVASRFIFGFPWMLCFSHGFTLAPNASETNALIDDVAMTNKQDKDGASEVAVNKVVPLE